MPPDIGPLTVPPNLKVAPRSLAMPPGERIVINQPITFTALNLYKTMNTINRNSFKQLINYYIKRPNKSIRRIILLTILPTVLIRFSKTKSQKSVASLMKTTSTAITSSLSSSRLNRFETISLVGLQPIIHQLAKNSCNLDPIPARLLLETADILSLVILQVVNLSLETAFLPPKLIKKPC